MLYESRCLFLFFQWEWCWKRLQISARLCAVPTESHVASLAQLGRPLHHTLTCEKITLLVIFQPCGCWIWNDNEEKKLTWPKPYTFWLHPEVARWIRLPLWQGYEMQRHTASSMFHPSPSLAVAYTHPHPSFSHPLCYPFPSFYFRKRDESEKDGLQKTCL